MINEENLETIWILLNDFFTFIENRSTGFLLYVPEVFPKILNWHFLIKQGEIEYFTKEGKSSIVLWYYSASTILDNMVKTIERRALNEKVAFPFFKYLKTHLENCKNSNVAVNRDIKYYREQLLGTFYTVFFENINESPERYEIWQDYFPPEWRVTETNLRDNKNYVSRISLNNFLRWCEERIRNPKEEFDAILDDVSLNLFPEVDPVLWAKILIFVLSPYANIKLTIERPWPFGEVGRLRTFNGVVEQDVDKFERVKEEMKKFEEVERKKTFELAFYLFKENFSKGKLENSIKDLEKLKYEKETQEEWKRLQLLDVFKSMLEFTSKN
jgi:hypothetical protein